jgi:hypothetical protein
MSEQKSSSKKGNKTVNDDDDQSMDVEGDDFDFRSMTSDYQIQLPIGLRKSVMFLIMNPLSMLASCQMKLMIQLPS